MLPAFVISFPNYLVREDSWPAPVFLYSHVGAHYYAIAELSTSPYVSDAQMSAEEGIFLLSIAVHLQMLASPQASTCRISREFSRAVLSSIRIDDDSSAVCSMSLGRQA